MANQVVNLEKEKIMLLLSEVEHCALIGIRRVSDSSGGERNYQGVWVAKRPSRGIQEDEGVVRALGLMNKGDERFNQGGGFIRLMEKITIEAAIEQLGFDPKIGTAMKKLAQGEYKELPEAIIDPVVVAFEQAPQYVGKPFNIRIIEEITTSDSYKSENALTITEQESGIFTCGSKIIPGDTIEECQFITDEDGNPIYVSYQLVIGEDPKHKLINKTKKIVYRDMLKLHSAKKETRIIEKRETIKIDA